ncbi:conserved hypothetical protein [Leptothrix cholodnii SP-6]|uniref:Protein-arginine rhamnosyltransferase n=1 Tax=Leptothrix cholodnii (strain ATCC 51168 / LMG 8142 / SP-6) TaxID=395495 RepID=B1Y0U2_LEPCP|nr:elongation factor P maturation arginine rhamnosyltransferase EarP [Leptothrix cholodnii]ACB34200.1 conserved hypothetical protein [Leptothrix cholodnii SP-6]
MPVQTIPPASSGLVSAPPQAPPCRSWDIFCRVIDNHGDLGVCWRLAVDLAQRGQRVRLWIDDASALAWMAPTGANGVSVRPWAEPSVDDVPGDAVIEAFGCDPPAGFVERMAQRGVAPLWINLEYLSAEAYVARSHRLQSPQWSGPGRGLTKWFFYPGFTPDTGGLLREPGLIERRRLHQAAAGDGAEALVITLFCYANAALPSLLDALVDLPDTAQPGGVRLKVTPGWAATQVVRWLGSTEAPDAGTVVRRGRLDIEFLPYLSQAGFDELLWRSDLNLVRGEDSLVRALWAGRPMLWQVYPQDDGAHLRKLDAFLQRYFGVADGLDMAAVRLDVQQVWQAWNGAESPPSVAQWHRLLAALRGDWCRASEAVCGRLSARPDLTSSLLEFAADHTPERAGAADRLE